MGKSPQISNLQMELKYLNKFKCYWILTDSGGLPLGGWGWVDVGGGGERMPPTHVHMHVHACTCTHAPHVYDIIGNSQGFPTGGGHLHEIIMFTTCVCMCMCACAHMWGHPPTTPYPHPPTPRATGSLKHQNSISLELIEIIWFCLKILYLWTFLNSYRL